MYVLAHDVLERPRLRASVGARRVQTISPLPKVLARSARPNCAGAECGDLIMLGKVERVDARSTVAAHVERNDMKEWGILVRFTRQVGVSAKMV